MSRLSFSIPNLLKEQVRKFFAIDFLDIFKFHILFNSRKTTRYWNCKKTKFGTRCNQSVSSNQKSSVCFDRQTSFKQLNTISLFFYYTYVNQCILTTQEYIFTYFIHNLLWQFNDNFQYYDFLRKRVFLRVNEKVYENISWNNISFS